MTRGPSPPLLHLPPEGLDSEASSSRHTVGGQFAPPHTLIIQLQGIFLHMGEQQAEETAVPLEVWGLKP